MTTSAEAFGFFAEPYARSLRLGYALVRGKLKASDTPTNIRSMFFRSGGDMNAAFRLFLRHY